MAEEKISKLLSDPSIVCCFSGHRPEKIPFDFSPFTPNDSTFSSLITLRIHEAYEAGYRVFVTGMARGFDLYAAENVIKYRNRNNCADKVFLVGVSPYRKEIDRLKGADYADYQSILYNLDDIIYLNENFTPACYKQRNQFMVDHSSRLIACCIDYKSGTGGTIAYARKKGLFIDNINLKGFYDANSDDEYLSYTSKISFGDLITLDGKVKKGSVKTITAPHPFSEYNHSKPEDKKQ